MWEKYKERNERIRQMKGLDTKINEKKKYSMLLLLFLSIDE